MAIETQTNFIVQAPKPADDRNVVADISARDDIEYKFSGLKTFVLSEGITYVYGTDSVWRPDGGVSNGGGGNGIYGGSGSLPGDVSVFLGTVSNSANDRSNYLYYESRGLTDGDKNSLYTYAYRRTNGNDWDSMSFRTEQKLTPFGNPTLQGPYIEFSGTNPFDVTSKGVLNIGVGDNTNSVNRVTRISLTPDQTEIYSSQDPTQEKPITFGKIGVDTFLGYNSNSLSNIYYLYNDAEPSYRIKFGNGIASNSDWDFQTRVIDDNTFNTVLKINNNTLPSGLSSPISFLVDSSSRDWDGGSAITPTLLTPQQIVRDIEHKYSKTQMWAAGTSNRIKSNVLYLNTDGNSFEVTLPSNQIIKHILAFKTDALTPEFPNGTIITIKFINSDSANPGYLKIHDGSTRSDSKIKSDLTDSTFEKNDNTRLTIDHANTTDKDGFKNGEVITFRKFDKGTNNWWEIVNVSRERKIVTRNWTSGKTTTEWNFLPLVRWLTATSSTGTFQNYKSTNFTNPSVPSLEHPYNKFAPPDLTTTGVGASRDTLNSDGFAFRISVDGNRIVFVQGNFRIDIKDDVYLNSGTTVVKKIYWSSYDQEKINIWAIGKITNVSLIPQWETVWSPVQVYARGEYTTNAIYRFEVINPVISINRLGDILLSFRAEPSYDSNLGVFMRNVNLEVWVPPFSYTAATGSYPTTTSGGGNGNPPGGV